MKKLSNSLADQDIIENSLTLQVELPDWWIKKL